MHVRFNPHCDIDGRMFATEVTADESPERGDVYAGAKDVQGRVREKKGLLFLVRCEAGWWGTIAASEGDIVALLGEAPIGRAVIFDLHLHKKATDWRLWAKSIRLPV